MDGGVAVAHAEDERHECAASAYEGQRLRDEGKLNDARSKFVQCGNPRCPSVVATDCAKWVTEVDARLPTIAIAAKDASGRDLEQVRVILDGKLVTERLDGRAIGVDPGGHTLRLEADGFPAFEERLVVLEGQKGRTVSAVLSGSAPRSAPAVATSGDPLWPALLTGGIGVAGVGAFAFLGASGQSEKNHLSDTCAPLGTCSEGDVSSARTKLLLADVSLGVGIVSLGAATYFLVRHLSTPRAANTAARIHVDVASLPSGAACTVNGSF